MSTYAKVPYKNAIVKGYGTNSGMGGINGMISSGSGTGLYLWTVLGGNLIPNVPNIVKIPQLIVTTSFNLISDSSLKCNITNVSEEDIDNLALLSGKTYNLKVDPNGLKHFGYIAQEVEPLYPNLVHTSPQNNIKSINYLELIPVLIAKINRLELEIIKLKEDQIIKDEHL